MTYRDLSKDLQAPLELVLDAASTALRKRVTDPDAKMRGPDVARIRAEVKRRLAEQTPTPPAAPVPLASRPAPA